MARLDGDLRFGPPGAGGPQCDAQFQRQGIRLPKGGKGGVEVARESYRGLNIKVTEFYDGVNDNSIMRLDVLFGWACTYAELACKYAL